MEIVFSIYKTISRSRVLVFSRSLQQENRMQTIVTESKASSTCHLASKNESFIISFSFQSTLHDRFSTYFFVEF